MANAIETLIPDEADFLRWYRRARDAGHATLEIHIQNGKLVHINFTEKYRPENGTPVRLRGAAA